MRSPTTPTSTAKLFKNGRSQAVRLPAEFRFEGTEVNIRRDPETGDDQPARQRQPHSRDFEHLVPLCPFPGSAYVGFGESVR